ncbi:MAG TPA: cell division protein FtsQ/DivIB [Xanthobacteraceae bacterium]|jgi:cell division protein FtsQ
MRRCRAAGSVWRFAERLGAKAIRWPPPPGGGVAGSILLLGATLSYGAIAGQHLPAVVGWFKEARDTVANSLGFDIAAISLTGVKEVSRDEVLSIAGVTGHASLLFLDADAARARLLANPWIADAAVLKLYPNRLQITIVERHPFALWQKHGRLSVIAADGTVLEPLVEQRYLSLPLVVGEGAERQAKDFLAIVDRYPALKAAIQASILVAQRRWNLRLNNGIDVRLPETNVAAALDRLVTLDRDKKLLSRDITAVDLRLPDRVSVRLSDAAAAARADALKDKTKKKGGDT